MRKKLITRQEIDDIRILIRHALIDMDYNGGGSYNTGVEDNVGGYGTDERQIKRAKRGIATIDRLLTQFKDRYEHIN